MNERVRDRDRTGPSCATCMTGLDAAPPAICSACRAAHHAPCVSAERRCTCGAPLFVPTLRSANTKDVQPGAIALTFLRRDLWKWLIPTPFWVASAWVLQTSERVWTETYLTPSGRTIDSLTVGELCRRHLIIGLLFFAIAPALVAWVLRMDQGTISASDHEPPPTWHRVVEWTVRLVALLLFASVAHTLWTRR